MGLTTDRTDSCLYEIDPLSKQQRCYLILPDGARKNLALPVRRSYLHLKCGSVTTMGLPLAETYAAQPDFYTGTFCVHCRDHFPVGSHGEFVWTNCDPRDTEGNGTLVGTMNERRETKE